MTKETLESKLKDKQLVFALKKHILPGTLFDINSLESREEVKDLTEGLKKIDELSEEELTELVTAIRNGRYEL